MSETYEEALLSFGLTEQELQQIQGSLDPTRVKHEKQIVFQPALFDYVPGSFSFGGRPVRHAVIVVKPQQDDVRTIGAILDAHPDIVEGAEIGTFLGEPERVDPAQMVYLLISYAQDHGIEDRDFVDFAYACRGKLAGTDVTYAMAKVFSKSGRLLFSDEALDSLLSQLEAIPEPERTAEAAHGLAALHKKMYPLPDNTAVRREYAQVLVVDSYLCSKEGDLLTGIYCAEIASELDTNCKEAWHNLGSMYHDLAVKIRPRNRLFVDASIPIERRRIERVICFAPEEQVKRFRSLCERSLVCYENALSIDPTLSVSWLGCGNVSFRLFRFAQAKACYNKVIDIEPDGETAAIARSQLQLLPAYQDVLGSEITTSNITPRWCVLKAVVC